MKKPKPGRTILGSMVKAGICIRIFREARKRAGTMPTRFLSVASLMTASVMLSKGRAMLRNYPSVVIFLVTAITGMDSNMSGLDPVYRLLLLRFFLLIISPSTMFSAMMMPVSMIKSGLPIQMPRNQKSGNGSRGST